MKRIIKVSLIFLLAICNVGLIPINASENTEKQEEHSINEFEQLEDLIDNNIKIVNGRYVYDVGFISNAVDSFNVESLNSQTKGNWTNESLKVAIIANLNSAKLDNTAYLRGTYCNLNYASNGWNYTRMYTSKFQTNQWIERFTDESIADAASGTILSAVVALPGGQLLGIPAFISGVSSLWKSMFARDLGKNNTGQCGVVSDVNSFTSIYTITPQSQWYE